MSRHARLETVGASPKMVAAGAVTTVLSILLAVATLLTDSQLLPLLPPGVQAVILAIIPPLLVIAAAYGASPGEVMVKPQSPVTDLDGNTV